MQPYCPKIFHKSFRYFDHYFTNSQCAKTMKFRDCIIIVTSAKSVQPTPDRNFGAIASSVIDCPSREGPIRFKRYSDIPLETRKVFLNLPGEYVFQTVSHHPVF